MPMPMLASSPPPDELYRKHRAFYRFKIYCNLFRARKPPTFNVYKHQGVFFSKFSPWENELLGCIHDYLSDEIGIVQSSPAMWLCFVYSSYTCTFLWFSCTVTLQLYRDDSARQDQLKGDGTGRTIRRSCFLVSISIWFVSGRQKTNSSLSTRF